MEKQQNKPDGEFDIQYCPSCGGRHMGCPVYFDKRPGARWLMYFECPVNGDKQSLTSGIK